MKEGQQVSAFVPGTATLAHTHMIAHTLSVSRLHPFHLSRAPSLYLSLARSLCPPSPLSLSLTLRLSAAQKKVGNFSCTR